MPLPAPELLAAAAGARLVGQPGPSSGPSGVTIDSRRAAPGQLFVGLRGDRVDGGSFAEDALAAGAWGVLVGDEHAARLAAANGHAGGGAVLAAEDPLRALQRLATARRRALGATVIGVTGSTGKTTTKDILAALLAPHRRTFASRANFNTEIGLPLELLAAPDDTEILVLEMGMRGAGQIAELAAIAEPEIAIVVSVGPVHLELLGSIEAIAAAKAELIAGLPPGGTAVIPAGEALLDPHRRGDVRTITFGAHGDVRLGEEQAPEIARIVLSGEAASASGPDQPRTLELRFPLPQAHLRTNLLAAVAAALAAGVRPAGVVEVELADGRGRRHALPSGAMLIDDCYNANPMSMRAALDDLAATTRSGRAARPVAILGEMLELGPDAAEMHRAVGRHARESAVAELIVVGTLGEEIARGYGGDARLAADAAEAALLAAAHVRTGDVVLVKASRGVGLETVCARLREEA